MAFLNFTARPIQIEKTSHPLYKTHFKMRIAPPEREEIISKLRDLTENVGSELRVDFPGEVTFFWKLREEESRLLLAHPEKEVWVATLALTHEHLQVWLNEIKELSGPVFLSELKKLGKFSNLEVSFEPLV